MPRTPPLPLAGRGRGWGSRRCGTSVPRGTTPHPDPPPQGGRESERLNFRAYGDNPVPSASRESSMDSIDRKILNELQPDASPSVPEIGHRGGLSPTPWWTSIQTL